MSCCMVSFFHQLDCFQSKNSSQFHIIIQVYNSKFLSLTISKMYSQSLSYCMPLLIILTAFKNLQSKRGMLFVCFKRNDVKKIDFNLILSDVLLLNVSCTKQKHKQPGSQCSSFVNGPQTHGSILNVLKSKVLLLRTLNKKTAPLLRPSNFGPKHLMSLYLGLWVFGPIIGASLYI